MRRPLTSLLILLLYSQSLHADFIRYFKDEEGHTNWQYVANFSSSLLILILSTVLIKLYLTHRRVRKMNAALEEIRNELEIRVEERTATLNESNRLLKETNRLLEKEVGHHQETTDKLKRSETYIKNILESMPLMLVGVNEDGIISQWNRKAEEITGIVASRALGTNLWQTYPAITISQQQVGQALEHNKPITIKHSQRGRYHFDIIIYPLREWDEMSVVILIEDVTQRVLTENMLIHRDKMSSMGEFSATMALDINTPLQAILGDVKTIHDFLDTQAKVNSDPEVAEHINQLNSLLNDASEKGRHACTVIDNLLDFSRTQSGQKHKASVVTIMDNTLELAQNLIAIPDHLTFRDIAITRDYENDLPQIYCYPAELQQVFLSLFRHSCHALSKRPSPREPRINIQIMECYENLWIKIQHNGLGLTLDEQKFIFEPFFNNPTDLDDPSKRLSFPYFIITEQHKGQMAVTSDIAVGTTFHMQIQLDEGNQ